MLPLAINVTRAIKTLRLCSIQNVIIMTKVVPYPILDSLKVPHQVAYDLIAGGVEAERTKFQMYEASGDVKQSDRALVKVLYVEKLLSFMRLNALASQKMNHFP